VVSQHLGDLENAATADEYERCIRLYRELYRFEPEILAVDAHPDYRSTRLGREWALRAGVALEVVQHHHAHAASVLAENRWSTDAPPVIAVVLDGLGYGLDESIWGGEFLLAGYGSCERLAHLKYAPMPGGTKAILEPWRNTFAQIVTHFGWDAFHARWGGTELARWLETRPLDALLAMVERGVNSPLTSSCGRLFDAVAAALGVCRDMIHYEGQAAIELEALATTIGDEGAYGFAIGGGGHLALLDPAPCWEELFDDLARGTDRRVIAARFHNGLARAIAALAARLAQTAGLGTVALSGGVLQNRLLHETLARDLRARGLDVLAHRRVPSNDGGLSLGQAAVAAARRLQREARGQTRERLS
jgi:hydrogenase maturation protein HypF